MVVTIIVLLILTGISLNLVTGSNGILQRAKNAVDTTNEKAVQEKLQLVMAELQMDYYAGGMEEATFADYLKTHDVYNLASGEMFVFQSKEDNTIRVEYYGKSDKEMADMELLFDLATNEITVESSNGEEKPTRKSWTVTYDANGGTGEVPASQKILQGANVNVNTTTTLTKQGYNFLGWALSNSATTAITNFEMPENDVTLYAIWEEWALGTTVISGTNYGESVNYTANGVSDWKIFSKDGDNIYLIAANLVEGSNLPVNEMVKNKGELIYTLDNNMVLVNWMIDSSNWGKFVDTTYAVQAVGGPTLAQLVVSVNEKMGTSYTEDTIVQSVYLSDKLYKINKSWWLASVQTEGVMYMWLVHSAGHIPLGNVDYAVTHDGGCGIRPLVRLKSDVKMNWNGTAWDLSN